MTENGIEWKYRNYPHRIKPSTLIYIIYKIRDIGIATIEHAIRTTTYPLRKGIEFCGERTMQKIYDRNQN